MKKIGLIIIGVLLVMLTFQSCSSKPEESLLKRYFNAVRMNDNATMSSMAIEPLTMDVTGFSVVSVSPEKVEPVFLPQLSVQEAELKKKVEDHVTLTLDVQDELYVAQDSKAGKKKIDELQAKYDEVFGVHKELQKTYNDAKSAAAREEEITGFSIGAKGLGNIRELTGDVYSKQVVVKVKTRDGSEKDYTLYMRRYQLKDEATNLKHNGRWIIIRFEPLVP